MVTVTGEGPSPLTLEYAATIVQLSAATADPSIHIGSGCSMIDELVPENHSRDPPDCVGSLPSRVKKVVEFA